MLGITGGEMSLALESKMMSLKKILQNAQHYTSGKYPLFAPFQLMLFFAGRYIYIRYKNHRLKCS
jgi:hypothetical protein